MRDGSAGIVVPSEGGHVDFGPRSDREDRLVAWLRERFGRATRERILSGSGLVLLWEFLARERAAKSSAAAKAAIESAEDRAAAISRLGLGRRDPLARAALSLVCRDLRLGGGQSGSAVSGDRRRLHRRRHRAEDPAGAPARGRSSQRFATSLRCATCSPGFRSAWFSIPASGSTARRPRPSDALLDDDRDEALLAEDELAPKVSIGPANLADARRRSSFSLRSGSPRRSLTSFVVMPSLRAPTVFSVSSEMEELASLTTRLRSELSTAAFEPMSGLVSESIRAPGVGRSL